MSDVYSASAAYKASKSMRKAAIERELTVAMKAVKDAVNRGEFHCITKCLSIQAKDALTAQGYDVTYNRDGNDADTCTINWLNAG